MVTPMLTVHTATRSNTSRAQLPIHACAAPTRATTAAATVLEAATIPQTPHGALPCTSAPSLPTRCAHLRDRSATVSCPGQGQNVRRSSAWGQGVNKGACQPRHPRSTAGAHTRAHTTTQSLASYPLPVGPPHLELHVYHHPPQRYPASACAAAEAAKGAWAHQRRANVRETTEAGSGRLAAAAGCSRSASGSRDQCRGRRHPSPSACSYSLWCVPAERPLAPVLGRRARVSCRLAHAKPTRAAATVQPGWVGVRIAQGRLARAFWHQDRQPRPHAA